MSYFPLLKRYTPTDANTLLQWKINEAAAPYTSAGTNALTLTVKSGIIVPNANTLFDHGANDFNNSAYLWSGNTAVAPAGASLTLSTWIYLNGFTGGFGGIVSKEYANNGTHNSPFVAFDLQWNSGVDGTWMFSVTTAATYTNVSVAAKTYQIPLNQWTLLAGTYDGATMRAYFNGLPAGTQAKSGNIDYGTGGPYYIGGYASGGNLVNGIVNDVRVESTVRSAAYLRNMYLRGVGLLY